MEDCWLINLALATGLTEADAEEVSLANVKRDICLVCPGAELI